MNNLFYTNLQFKIFAEDLCDTFIKFGFEIIEEPYIDYALFGFRATYMRRYLLQKPTTIEDGFLTTLIHVVGMPFGQNSQKMVILSTSRNIRNEPTSESLKLRIHFDDDGLYHVVHNEQPSGKNEATTSFSNDLFAENFDEAINNHANKSSHQSESPTSKIPKRLDCQIGQEFAIDLASYVSHIIEAISPGLIQLPTEMKLEILKKLNVNSIIRMSQVNSEFRSIIFQHGESLWRHLCFRDFGIRVINRSLHRSWIELYRDSYFIHQVEICRKERALPGLPERPALPPAPYILQIEWLPEDLEHPYYPLEDEVDNQEDNQFQLALEFHPLRRANSLDGTL